MARLQSGKSITLRDAADLIPLSFKVIKEFFNLISSDYLIPPHIIWIFKEIINIINNIDIKELSCQLSIAKNKDILKDPYLYFYETFLGELDPQKRKSKGVYYTPSEVVSFITNSVDKILTDKFDMPKG